MAHFALVKLLVSNGADAHIKTDGGLTAADIAKERGYKSIAWFLYKQ